MPRFVHPRTSHEIHTEIPREAAELRSHGYREQQGPVFDPTERTAEEVLDYLEDPQVDFEEINRVVTAEREGKARKTILNWTPPAADDEHAGDLATTDGQPQSAAGDVAAV